MAAKFKEEDKVTCPRGEGVIVYVTPAEKLEGREQTYHVECKNGSTYDVNESDIKHLAGAASGSASTAAPAPAGHPSPAKS